MIKFAAFGALAATSAALSLPPNPSINRNLSSFATSLIPNLAPTDLTVNPSLDVSVENCGYNRARTRDQFRKSRSLVLKTLVDSALGTHSRHGFRAMFKSDSAVTAVEAILASIYYYKPKPGLLPEPDLPKGPRISCVVPDSAQKYRGLDLGYDPWQRCWAEAPSPAFYAEGTAYLFLCPAFFALEDSNDIPHCPTVQNNKFEGDPNVFYRSYQTYTLLYHLLRFYLGQQVLDRYTDPREQLDWNKCVGLGTDMVVDTVRNPTSLELYIALVSQDCTEVPEPPIHNPKASVETNLESLPTKTASYSRYIPTNNFPFFQKMQVLIGGFNLRSMALATGPPLLNASIQKKIAAPAANAFRPQQSLSTVPIRAGDA